MIERGREAERHTERDDREMKESERGREKQRDDREKSKSKSKSKTLLHKDSSIRSYGPVLQLVPVKHEYKIQMVCILYYT